jgi:type I restriction enzyme S subunit
MKEFSILIPPMEEQNKIVDILDKFDELINNINIGLPCEIELRKKQYEYYRNKLLSFEEL